MTSKTEKLQSDTDISSNLNNATRPQKNENGNTTDFEYVMLFKSIFERKLFPDDFDTWEVSQQHCWINKNLATFYPNVPKTLLEFIPASFCPADDESPLEAPDWLDLDKYRRGQKFVKDHFITIGLTIIISTLHAYTFEDTLQPFIMGNKTQTPFAAFKRYRSTMYRMKSWFDGDPWVKGTASYKDMQITRKMHSAMRKKLYRMNNDEIDAAYKIERPWCPDREVLLEDFAEACPFEKSGQRFYATFAKSQYRPKSLSCANLTVIQCSFCCLVLLYPEKFGAHYTTDEMLESFCHVWRVYGYLLGIKDEYNFCRGSLEEVKQRARDFYQYWVIPNFKNMTPEWEHMTRCVIESMNYYPLFCLPYKVGILMATDTFDINMSLLLASCSYWDRLCYKLWKFVLRHAAKLSIVRVSLGNLLLWSFGKVLNTSPEKEEQLREKSKKQLENGRQ